jgi:hypothetical protein
MSSDEIKIVQDHVYIPSNFACIVAATYDIFPNRGVSKPNVNAVIFICFDRSDKDYLIFEDGDPDGNIENADYESLIQFSSDQIQDFMVRSFDDDFWMQYKREPETDDFRYFFSEEEFSSAYPNVEKKRWS